MSSYESQRYWLFFLHTDNRRRLYAHIWKLNDLVLGDSLGDLVDPVGDFLWCGSTVGNVELDTEIVVRSTGVMTCREQDTTVGLFASDQGRNGRSREDGILTEDNVLNAITSRDSEDLLHSLG